MAKKLRGDTFYLTGNDVKSGSVIYFTKENWSNNFKKAIKIKKNEMEKYQKLANDFEAKGDVISPFFIELNDDGKLRKLRDIIRKDGISIKI